MKFIRYNYKKGDKIIVNHNPCNSYCRCSYYSHKDFANKKGICENTEYTIKEIHNFGGGCPAILLEIEELPNTHSFNDAVGANWFMPYTKTE